MQPKLNYTWFGRWRLGERVPLVFQTRNTSWVATNPSAAPQISIYAADGTEVVSDQKIPPLTIPHETGTFAYGQLLGSDFSAGIYTVYASFTVSGTGLAAWGMFQVLAGGDDQGVYTSLHYYQTPTASFIVGTTEDGTRDIRRTPYIS